MPWIPLTVGRPKVMPAADAVALVGGAVAASGAAPAEPRLAATVTSENSSATAPARRAPREARPIPLPRFRSPAERPQRSHGAPARRRSAQPGHSAAD